MSVHETYETIKNKLDHGCRPKSVHLWINKVFLFNKFRKQVNTPKLIVCIWADNFNGRLILGLISLTIGYFKLGKGS